MSALPPLTTLTRSSERDWARKWSDLYDSDTAVLEQATFRARRDAAVDYVLRLLRPGGRVLDLGCGSAPVLAELRRLGIDCTGLDQSADMLQGAEQRLHRLGLDAGDLYLGDCVATEFETASFDVIVCLGVVSYVEDYARVFEEIHRLLKPGGCAIVSFRNRHGPILWDPVKALKWLLKLAIGRAAPEPFRVARFMDHREVCAVAADHGFEQREFLGLGYGPVRLNGSNVLSESASIRLSSAMARLVGRLGSDGIARWLADVSFWVYAKPAAVPLPSARPVRHRLSRTAA